ncbi:MAG: PilZ domain-containing protein [Planctomycetota bacterium]
MIMPILTRDRRRSPRVPCEKPVKVRCGQTGKYLTGETVDVSDGGCLMRLDRRVIVETGQNVRVGIAHRPVQTLILADDMIEGHIVRRFGHGDTQHVAVSFGSSETGFAEAG